MVDQAEEEVANAISAEKSQLSGGGNKKLVFMLAAAVVVLAGAAGGMGLHMMTGAKSAAPAQAQAQESSAAEEPVASESATEGHGGGHGEEAKPEAVPLKPGEYQYYEIEPIIVNLDEPRLARYVRASIVLAVKSEDFKTASTLLEKKKPEMKSWLTVYLAGCTLEDVRGPKNLNRIRREIQASVNDQLWPNSKGLVDKVLFKEFAVQ